MSKSVIINGNTYPSIPQVNIPLSGEDGYANFYDTSDADAAAGDVLNGKIFYKDGKKVGSMVENGSTGGTISTKAGVVTIPSGHTSGGTVSIDSTEQAKIIAANIKNGVTLLGQSGKSTVVDTEISSGGASAGTILTGYSAYVNGSLVSGEATMPTVSQDSSTHILTIS